MTKGSNPFAFLVAVGLAAAAIGCGDNPSSVSSVSGPEMPAAPVSPPGGATIEGTVQSGANASGQVGASSASGLWVSVTGTTLRTPTDGAGRFTLTGVPEGRVELRFEGPGVDARLEVQGLQSGQTLRVTIRVSGNTAWRASDDDGEVEFEGKIDSVGTGSLMVAGRTVKVDAATRILDSRGLVMPLSGLSAGDFVEVEGMAQPDGSVLARKVKLEHDDDDEGHRQEVEFEGTISTLSPLTVSGRFVTTDGSTKYLGRKDEALTAADVLKLGNRVEVEGFRQADDSVLARKIKLEK